MENSGKSLRCLLIFAAGVFLMIALNFIAVWTDLESTFYGFVKFTDQPLTSLRCPILMTTGQGVATASVSVRNTTDNLLRPTIRVDVGSPGPWRNWNQILELDPGERESYRWEVSAGDAVFRNMVFTKATMYSAYPLPSRDSSCGIMVVNIPFLTGTQLAILVYGLGLLGMVLGGRMWQRADPSLLGRGSRAYMAMVTLGALVTAGMVASFIGGWVLNGILFIISMLLIFVLALNASPSANDI